MDSTLGKVEPEKAVTSFWLDASILTIGRLDTAFSVVLLPPPQAVSSREILSVVIRVKVILVWFILLPPYFLMP